MPTSYHAHPFTILTHLTRVVYLIIIPVARGFLGALSGDFSSWLQGAWIDISILLLMAAIAVWSWYRVTYTYDDAGIRIASGVAYRRHTRIPWNKVTTVSVVDPITLRPFHAVRFHADTLGGRFKNADFSILLTPKRAEAIMVLLREPPALGASNRNYIPDTRSILALSLLTSNSFAGIVFIATFVSQAGKLLGNEFSEMLIGTVEEAARTLAFGIPPAAAVLAYILLFGWMIAFLRSFIRYKNMYVSRRKSTFTIAGGLLTHREYTIAASDVNFIDIRQSVATKALCLYSLYISAVGYGKQKDDISCIIPTENQKKFSANIKSLFPGFDPTPRQIAPPKFGFMKFINEPLVPCLLIPLAMVIFIYFIPDWTSFILFAGLMSLVPSAAFMIVRIFDFVTSGISFDESNYTLRYSKGFSLHTVIIPSDKIVLVELHQSIWQRFSNHCDLYIRTVAEGRSIHHCRNLSRPQLQELFKI